MIKLSKILNEIKLFPAGSRIYFNTPDEKRLRNPKGKDLEVGSTVYFLTDKGYYQKTRVTKISRQQTTRITFYYKIYIDYPNTGWFLLNNLYVLKNLDEIKLFGKGKFSKNINWKYKVDNYEQLRNIRDQLLELGYEDVFNFITSKDADGSYPIILFHDADGRNISDIDYNYNGLGWNKEEDIKKREYNEMGDEWDAIYKKFVPLNEIKLYNDKITPEKVFNLFNNVLGIDIKTDSLIDKVSFENGWEEWSANTGDEKFEGDYYLRFLKSRTIPQLINIYNVLSKIQNS